jgi:hypothetical protein
MTSTTASPQLWASLRGDEYPPEAEVVWTTNGESVCKGQWFWGWEPPAPFKPLKDGTWKDMDGNPIEVTTWLWIEDSPDSPPAPPPPTMLPPKSS